MIDGQASLKRKSRVGRVATAALLLTVLAILLSLGTWQVRRLVWKEGLLATVAERQQASPVDVGTILGTLTASQNPDGVLSPIEYVPMTATGVFQHDAEQFFFATHEGQTGYYVYTPLALAGGQYLFVNRGFVPYDDKDMTTRLAGEVQGEVTVTGLARSKLLGKPSMMVPDNEPTKNIFYWKDLDAMAENANLPQPQVLQFFLDADATPNPGGLPVGGVTQINFPNNHLQYAITWYGLAATLVVISGIFWWRGRSQTE